MGDIKTYKLFLLAAQMGSITRAAEAMNIDRTAASRKIKSLEDSFGKKLLKSTNRGCKLTNDGSSVCEQISEIVEKNDSMVKGFSKDNKKIFRIASTESLITNYLSFILPNFLKKEHGFRVEIIAIDNRKSLTLENYDLSLIPKSAYHTELIQEDLFMMSLNLYASKEYIQENGTIEKLGDIENHRLITFGNQNKFDLALSSWPLCSIDNDENLVSHITVNCVTSMVRLSEAGLGVIGIYDKTLDALGSKLERISNNITQENAQICLSYPEKSLNNIMFRKLRDYILENEKSKIAA
jgi:DNA-binding transcriptional LysR family regulator